MLVGLAPHTAASTGHWISAVADHEFRKTLILAMCKKPSGTTKSFLFSQYQSDFIQPPCLYRLRMAWVQVPDNNPNIKMSTTAHIL